MACQEDGMDELSAVLHTALASVLKNQPADPLLHLMSHFREKAGLPGSTALSSAYRTLRLCSANSHHCDGNVMEAWSILGASSDGIIAAEQFMELISMLLEPLPDELKQQMLELLAPIGKLPPDYATFRAATKSCLLLEELASYQPDRSLSDQAFGEAEARRLLTHLIQQRRWFMALQPMPSGTSSVTCLSAAAAEEAVGGQQQRAAAEQQAAQLVELALAAVKTSEDG